MAEVMLGRSATGGRVRRGRRAPMLVGLVGLAIAAGSACLVQPTTQEYFLLTADRRLCASPTCGGQFVQAVNSDLTHCPDGSEAERCYVSDVDYRALGGAPLRDRSITLVRGAIVSKVVPTFGEVGQLVVEEAWGSASEAQPLGTFVRLADNGLRCFTTPCFSTDASSLNHDDVFVLSDLDVSSVAPISDDPEAVARALGRGDLIASGEVVASDGGTRRFAASQLFLPLRRACTTAADCDAGEVCADSGFCAATGSEPSLAAPDPAATTP
jgi:hypothetical protein